MMFVVLLLAQVGRLRTIPFALPYWAYTFPLAAAATAATAMAGARPQVAYDVVAAVLLGFSTALVLGVAELTLRAAARGQICVPEEDPGSAGGVDEHDAARRRRAHRDERGTGILEAEGVAGREQPAQVQAPARDVVEQGGVGRVS